MTTKDTLRMVVQSMEETQATREWIQTESALLHARIESLISVLGVVFSVLKNRGLEDLEIQVLDSIEKTLNNKGMHKKLRRISSVGIFQRDQSMAEIENLKRLIDGLPDE